MMQHYFVKKGLFGISAGSVERFAPHKAGALVLDGSIEPYDEKKKQHREAPGSPENVAKATAERDRRRKQDLEAEATTK